MNETLRHDPPVWTRQERSAPTEDEYFVSRSMETEVDDVDGDVRAQL